MAILYRVVLIVVIVLSAQLSITTGQATAQDSADPTVTAQSKPDWSLSFGLKGHLRLGRWAPINIQRHPDRNTDIVPTHFEATALDGDGYRVIYSGRLLQDAANPNHWQGWIRPGRRVSEFEVKLFAGSPDSNEPIATKTISIDSNMIAKSTQPLAISISTTDQSRDAFAATAAGRADDKNKIVVDLESVSLLPIDALGLDGVNTILMVARNEVVDQLTEQRVDALDRWVNQGGSLVLSFPAEAEPMLGEAGKLKRFSPGSFLGTSTIDNSSPLESFVKSRNQLIGNNSEPIAVAKLNVENTRPLVTIGDLPLVTRQARGAGQIIFVAFDLDSPQLTEWANYSDLIRSLVSQTSVVQEESRSTINRSGSVSHYGYTDLMGQLRVPLDRFSNVGFIPFTLIAILIGVYILLIGPVDYFLLRRLFGKMELTWITFPFFSILFCGIALWLSQWTRPGEIQINQLEIIDVDVETGRVQGTVWSNLYSPTGGRVDVTLEQDHELGFQVDDYSLTWNGLPGNGLGGMLTRPGVTGNAESYQQHIESTADGKQSISLHQLPLQVSSSRSLFTQWSGQIPVSIRSQPRYRNRLRRVTGSIKNPFDFELSNCRLLYAGWAYELDEPLAAGDTFDIITDSDERNLLGHLTRKKSTSGKTRNYSVRSSWNPAEPRLNRLADILMFYEAAGGASYTGMTHEYYPHVDLSDQLNLDRAILVGEVNRQGAEVLLNGGELKTDRDNFTTIVRVILPVENEKEDR
ncbi:MAG: hypothetical protein AAFN77_14520 [Planctomycetota bacterium]